MKRIVRPDATYLADTVLLPIPTTGDDLIAHLADASLQVTISPVAKRLAVPAEWTFWGAPPDTEEGHVNAILWSRGKARLRLRLSRPVSILGVEVSQPVAAALPITVEFKNGSQSLGQIKRPVHGNQGARLFAAKDDTFTEIVISVEAGPFASGGFAFARFRCRI